MLVEGIVGETGDLNSMIMSLNWNPLKDDDDDLSICSESRKRNDMQM